MSQRFLIAAVVASLAASVLPLRVFTSFEATRAKLVRAPITAGPGPAQVALDANPLVRSLTPPFAAIWRVEHDGRTPATFQLRVDGRIICERTVAPRAIRRHDCVVRESEWGTGSARTLTVHGPAYPWRLHPVELASHHGGSVRLLRSYIVPAEKAVRTPGPLWGLAAWFVLLALFLSPAPRPRSRTLRAAYRSFSAVIAATWAVLLVAPWVTPYKLLIPPGGWAFSVGILAMPHLWALVPRGVARVQPRARRAIVTGLVVALCAFAAARIATSKVRHFHGGNYSGLLHISQDRFDRDPLLRDRADIRASLLLTPGTGYDAQFMYFAVFDPWLTRLPKPETYRGFIDAPPYRYGRSGFVWLTKMASGDRWQAYPAVMVWLVVAGIAATAAALALIARHHGASPAWGLIVLLIPGMWRSLVFALPEPVAAALVAAALLCVMKERWVLAIAMFAAALLVRETSALVLLLSSLFLVRQGRLRIGISLLWALVPLLLWRMYVGSMLYPDWGLEGFIYAPPVYDLPGRAIADVYASLSRGTYSDNVDVARAAFWYPALLLIAAAVAGWMTWRRASIVTVSALAYAITALCLDRELAWAHVFNVERTSYETFVMLAIATVSQPPATARSRIALAGFWGLAGAYLLYGTVDAGFLRENLLFL